MISHLPPFREKEMKLRSVSPISLSSVLFCAAVAPVSNP
jgi:hypothetical protein